MAFAECDGCGREDDVQPADGHGMLCFWCLYDAGLAVEGEDFDTEDDGEEFEEEDYEGEGT